MESLAPIPSAVLHQDATASPLQIQQSSSTFPYQPSLATNHVINFPAPPIVLPQQTTLRPSLLSTTRNREAEQLPLQIWQPPLNSIDPPAGRVVEFNLPASSKAPPATIQEYQYPPLPLPIPMPVTSVINNTTMLSSETLSANVQRRINSMENGSRHLTLNALPKRPKMDYNATVKPDASGPSNSKVIWNSKYKT